MTTDTLAEAVLGEAEAIVCAEWMRLQHSALREEEFTGPHAEMPAARPRPPRVATLTTTLRPPGMTHCGHKGGWPARWWPGLPVWATQRSPPQHRGALPKSVVEQRR